MASCIVDTNSSAVHIRPEYLDDSYDKAWIMAPIGLLINLVSGVVLLRFYLSCRIYRLYVSVLWLSDMLFIGSGALRELYLAQVTCKTYGEVLLLLSVTQLLRFGLTMSGWMTATLATVRFLGVRFPLFTNRRVTQRNSAIAVALISLAALAVNFDYFAELPELFYQRRADGTVSCCYDVNMSRLTYFLMVYSLGYLVLRSILPVVLIVLLNGLTVQMLLKQKHSDIRTSARRKVSAWQRTDRSMRQITFLIICVSALFVVSTVPRLLMSSIHTLGTVHYLIYGVPWRAATSICEVLSHSLNFPLYLSFDRRFRQDVTGLLQSCGRVVKRVRRQSVRQMPNEEELSIALTSTAFVTGEHLHSYADEARVFKLNGAELK